MKADPVETTRWLKASAEGGVTLAQTILATAYRTGDGVPKDINEALKWFHKAAEKGETASMLQLAGLYCGGEEIPQNLGESFKWAKLCAEKCSDPMAEYLLGIMYDYQQEDIPGVQRNSKTSYYWMLKSAEQGCEKAQVAVAEYLRVGFGVEKDELMAVKWLKKAAEKENPKAQILLSQYYLMGIGVEADLPTCLRWGRKAAETGDEKAQDWMDRLANGGLPGDKETYRKKLQEALKALQQNAKKGDDECLYDMIWLSICGEDTPESRKDAQHWLKIALKRNYFPAIRVLAERSGLEDCTAIYQKAAENGCAEAQYEYGMHLNMGIGVKRNLIESALWLVRADSSGNAKARQKVRANLGKVDVSNVEEEFNKRSENGDVEAPFLIYWMTSIWRGERELTDKAKAYLVLSATRGFERAEEECDNKNISWK